VAVPDVRQAGGHEEQERPGASTDSGREREHEDDRAGRDSRYRDDVRESEATPLHRRPQERDSTTSLLTHERVSNTPLPSMAMPSKSGTPIGLICALSSSVERMLGMSRLLYWIANGMFSRSYPYVSRFSYRLCIDS